MKKTKVSQEVKDSLSVIFWLKLAQRKEILKAGFNTCYTEKGEQLHCNSCVEHFIYLKELNKHEKNIKKTVT